MKFNNITFLLAYLFLLFSPTINAESTRSAILAAPCAGCHGTDGKSPGSIPSLFGRSPSYIANAMNEYKNDKRPGSVMNRIAKGYSNEEIQLLSNYFKELK